MTLTDCQQVILWALFIAPEDPTGFVKLRNRNRQRNLREDPKVLQEQRNYMAKRRAENPELFLARDREWKRKNPEAVEAQNLYAREYRKNNLELVRAIERKKNFNLRRKLNLLKLGRPCYDCGGMFPSHCMDWDHLPQFEKKFNIGASMASHCLEDNIAEINKCQLVCANCHRERSNQRKLKKEQV